MKKTVKPKKRVVKAWAMVYLESGDIQEVFRSEGNPHYTHYQVCSDDRTDEADLNALVELANARHRKGNLWEIVPCEIVYQLPKSKA